MSFVSGMLLIKVSIKLTKKQKFETNVDGFWLTVQKATTIQASSAAFVMEASMKQMAREMLILQ